jgi:hypothetical protein
MLGHETGAFPESSYFVCGSVTVRLEMSGRAFLFRKNPLDTE